MTAPTVHHDHGMRSLLRMATGGAPLICFVSIAHGFEDQPILGWLYAYLAAGALAGMLLVVASLQMQVMDDFTLGSNCYLLSGGIAVASGATWLLQSFDALRESGIFLFALAITVTRAVIASRLDHRQARHCVQPDKLWLLCGAPALAVTVSYMTQGHPVFSTLVPVVLLLARDRLQLQQQQHE